MAAKKILMGLVLISSFSVGLFGQEVLDVDKYNDCELFAQKKDFDKQERLEQIKKLGGKTVTVFIVKAKNNKIKNKYTGVIDLTLINKGKLPIDNLTSVLVVNVDNGNGQISAYFPLTDNKSYRIYLTDCLDKQ